MRIIKLIFGLAFSALNVFSQSDSTLFDISRYQVKPYYGMSPDSIKPVVYRFYTIPFYFDRDSLLPVAYLELDSIVQWLTVADNITIEIGVHMDTRWSSEYSNRLPVRRAEKIRDYLVRSGIRPERLIAKGYGSTEPIFSSDVINQIKGTLMEEQAERINRRVEIRVMWAEAVHDE